MNALERFLETHSVEAQRRNFKRLARERKELQYQLNTVRVRGPRVNIKIRFLLEYLTFFNRPKIYLKRDEAA